MLTKAIDVDVGVLKRCSRADGQMTTVEIIPTADKCAVLRPSGTPGGHATQRRPARAIDIVAAIDRAIEIKPVVEPGGVHSASTAIDIDIAPGLEACPGMGILAQHTNGKLISDAVIDAQGESAGSKVVALCIPIAVHIDKVTESSHPHAPAVFKSGPQKRSHDAF